MYISIDMSSSRKKKRSYNVTTLSGNRQSGCVCVLVMLPVVTAIRMTIVVMVTIRTWVVTIAIAISVASRWNPIIAAISRVKSRIIVVIGRVIAISIAVRIVRLCVIKTWRTVGITIRCLCVVKLRVDSTYKQNQACH
jgi:hypothetical protein